jgi:ketosteroid isomerase-like protein
MSSEDRLTAIEAHIEISNLEGEYARTWDTGDAEGWAALFTEDGVFEMAGIGGSAATRIVGRRELADFCTRIGESFEGLHLLHVPSLTIEGDSATGWVHFEFRSLKRTGGATELGIVAGVYQITYAKTEDGWRIRNRYERAVLRNTEAYFGVPGFSR